MFFSRDRCGGLPCLVCSPHRFAWSHLPSLHGYLPRIDGFADDLFSFRRLLTPTLEWMPGQLDSSQKTETFSILLYPAG